LEIIDAQVHVLEPDTVARPWTPTPQIEPLLRVHEAYREALIFVDSDGMITAMDAVGVDRAVVVATPNYGWGATRQIGDVVRHPGRLRLIGLVDHRAVDVAEQIEAWRTHPSAAGVRLLLLSALGNEAHSDAYDPLLDAAERCGLPTCVLADDLNDIATMASEHPNLPIVLDHLALAGHDTNMDPFAALPAVLELARFDNITVKMTGTACLSHEPAPFNDLWPPLHQALEAFGTDRVMWGSDWTRVQNASYREAVEAFTETDELTVDEKEQILSKTARRVFGW
jgi:L-fuconolactonase